VQFGAGTGAINFNHTSSAYTFAPSITGNGTINVLAGTTILTPDSSAFTGTTTVAGGTLRVDGTLGGAVNVTTGGTLGGTGTITGPVTVGGTLSAGASPGTLTVGTLTLNAGSTSRFELNSPGVVGGTTNDLVVVTGNLTLGGALDAQVAAGGYYRLFNYGGTLAGAFDTTTVTGTGGFTPARQQVETSIPNQVNLAVVGTGQTLHFWDGADSTGNGTVDGGDGTWSNTGTNWTGQPGQANINGTWGGSVGVFAGTAGTITVAGTQAFDTLQFSTTGYVVGGNGTLAIAPAVGTTGTINVDAGVAVTIGTTIADGTGSGLNKIGPGTLILVANHTYTGGTTITAGTLQIGNGAPVLGGSIIGNVVNNGALVFANGFNDTFAGVISGSGSVQHIGNSSVVLTGANTYTGGTIIHAGAIQIGNDGTSGSIVGNVVVAENAALAFARSDTYTFDGVISGAGGIFQFGVGGTTVLTAAHTYTGNTSISFGTLALGAGGSIANSSRVGLGIDTAFDITAAGNQTINNLIGVAGSTVRLGANTLTVNVTGNRTFSGAITGTGGLVVTGAGSMTLNGSSTYTGATSVAAGTLTLGAAGSIAPSSAVTVAAGATFATTGGGSHTVRNLAGVAGATVSLGSTLTVDNATTAAFDGAITGTGSLIKSGAATWTFGGSASHTGATTINAGTLLVNGTVGGTVTVNAGGTLGGTGTITGPVTVGGTLSAGASPGTLTVGTLTLNTGSTSRFELNAPGVVGGTTNDLVVVTGNLTLGGALDAQVAAGGYYRLFNYGGTLAGAFDSTAVTGTGGFAVARQQVETAVPNQVNLAVLGTGQTLHFWDGADSTGNGSVDGGNGTWSGAGTNWTGQPGQANVNGTWGGSVGVFTGAAGTVSVSGTQAFDTLQFSTTGYTLSGGTLAIAPAVGTTGTINIETGVTATIGSVIADGTGSGLNKIGPGTLILTGANTYSGGTTITAGTLQLGNGGTTGMVAGNVASSGSLAFNRADSVTFDGIVSGTGGLRQIGTGTTVLTAASPYSGPTAVENGRLVVNGTIGSSIVTVTGGTLGGTGTVGGIVANRGGTVSPGNSIGTLNVAGNVSFGPGSTYEVEIEPAGTGDRLNATGTATLSGGTVSVIKAAGSYTSGTRYTILTATAGVSGTFDGFTQNLPFINLALAYDPNTVFLDVTRNTVSFCSLAGAPNQCAVANGAESLGAGNTLYDAIASLPDAASAQRAFNALSGEVHASTRSALIEDSHYLRDAVVARTRLSGTSTAAGPQFAALAQATDQSQRPQDGTAITAWFQGFGAIARTSGDGNAATAKRTTGGFFIGADTKIADTWTIGLATGYSRSTIDVDGRSSRATIDSYHLALYGGAQFGAIGVRLGASHTWHSIDSSRSITFPGVADAARADY
ncbi:autotransporter-associated beta strand repeat-containing protein, partial [Reyranella sp. CPCC 100927]|uniref:autotransporter-associated beta strand repeat-containing protein n=1 Tax=Reyranella sp. CPCC 100927 TaxID=2599616 RepID=UPI0011B75C4D